MTTVSPVSYNNGFSSVENSTLSKASLIPALAGDCLGILQKVVGIATPTAAGNYAVQNNSTDVILPTGASIIKIVVEATTTLAGGTSVEPVLATTSGGGSGVTLVAAVSLALANAGYAPALVAGALPIVLEGSQYLSIESLGVFTSGVAQVTVYYV